MVFVGLIVVAALVGLAVHRLGWPKSRVLALDTLLVGGMVLCAALVSVPSSTSSVVQAPQGPPWMAWGPGFGPMWRSCHNTPPTADVPIPPAECAAFQRMADTNARLAQTPFPDYAQPPDPCGLLTTAELSAALGAPVGRPAPSKPAIGTENHRECGWSTRPSMYDGSIGVGVSITTLAACKELVLRQREAYLSYPSPPPSLSTTAIDQMAADLLHKSIRAHQAGSSPIPGLGDAAYPDQDGQGVTVLVGTTVIHVGIGTSDSARILSVDLVIPIAREAVAHLR